MSATREDNFVAVAARLESSDDPHQFGDGGRACGRFQWHPSAYATWGPHPEDFDEQEWTWDRAFEFALRRFHRAARATAPKRTDLEILMAWHLHGQIRFTGWDRQYEIAWLKTVQELGLGTEEID